MKKKIFVLFISLIMLVSINFVAHSSGEPTEAFLGMYGVEIASVDLDTWDISYFDIPEYWSEAVVEALKYFPEEEKLVFAVTTKPTEDYSYNVGMIDVKTGKVTEFDERIMSYYFRTVKNNKIYFSLEDNEIISYDLSEDKKEVEFRGNSIKEEIEFYKEEVSPETPDYDKDEFLEVLIEQNIMPEEAEDHDLLFHDGGINAQLYEDYFMARRDDQLIVVEILDDEELEFEVVNESPEGFRERDGIHDLFVDRVEFKFD